MNNKLYIIQIVRIHILIYNNKKPIYYKCIIQANSPGSTVETNSTYIYTYIVPLAVSRIFVTIDLYTNSL